MRIASYSVVVLSALSGCAAEQRDTLAPSTPPQLTSGELYHVPDFARIPYAPLSRADAVGIAMSEWRAFGELVDDDPPRTRPPLAPEQMPSRMPGLWQRVGEYWWLGQNANRREAAWTGKHDAEGTEFAAEQSDYFAWSAAFISYVMRLAGAGDRFPYAASHYVYINAAARQALGRETGWVVTARRPADYAPAPGDIICAGRDRSTHMQFKRLPARPFPAHCDIVATIEPGQLSVLGGNVDNAVAMKHVPVGADGRLAAPDGTILDIRYNWFVVLQVQYAQ
jgi:Uncharacterized protein conserved in bacteria (DUF2272)